MMESNKDDWHLSRHFQVLPPSLLKAAKCSRCRKPCSTRSFNCWRVRSIPSHPIQAATVSKSRFSLSSWRAKPANQRMVLLPTTRSPTRSGRPSKQLAGCTTAAKSPPRSLWLIKQPSSKPFMIVFMRSGCVLRY